MACVGCGSELSSSYAFCPRCGQRQRTPCLRCGLSCEADHAFCPRCGTTRSGAPGAEGTARGLTPATTLGPRALARTSQASLPEAALCDADRRDVTILFADLSGFTALSERLDAEDVRAFQAALFEQLAQATIRYGGFVDKFMGDAILAVFGAPVAHEDDPERALRSALDMLHRAAALSSDWEPRLGQPVDLHVAVHTGPVVAGSLGHAAGATYEVTGDTVNTASRLLGAAAPGTIVVSDSTQVLTRHAFLFEAAGEVALRGKAQPVRIHRLLGILSEPRSARGLAAFGLAAPIVGRDDELKRLVMAFERTEQGRAELVSLVGEAGEGKSRLIEEFLARLEADGRLGRITVRRAACSSLGAPTYGVFGALLREAYQVRADDPLHVAHTKLAAQLRSLGAQAGVNEVVAPVLSYVLGLDPMRPRDLDPEQLKRQISLAARILLEQRLQRTGLLIVVEDFHWADAASSDLLRDVTDHLADWPLMVLLSHRPDASAPRVSRAAQSVIQLSPLSPEQTRSLVAGLFGRANRNVFAEVQDFVATRAGGNPLFIEEMVRSLVTTGVLVNEGSGWTSTAPCTAITVPPTLQGLLLSRVDNLPAEARRLLQEAAVLGAVFDEELLLAVASDAERAEAALKHLAKADLIQRVDAEREMGRYRFKHALVHEAVYQNLLISRRSELHERAGRALEQATGAYPERLSDLEALGHHWSLSADKARGARYLTAAGDWARALYANEDAIRHYGRALHTLTDCQCSADQVRAVRERLADLLALTGLRSEALVHYGAVQQEIEPTADRSVAARLHRKIGCLHWEGGDRERATACFTSGLELLEEEGDPLERAQLFQELGRLTFRAGDNAGAIAWAERALTDIAREKNSEDEPERSREKAATQAHAYNTVGVALARMGRLQEAVGQIEQSIVLAERHNLLQGACRGYTNLGVLYSSINPQRSIETCLRGLEIARKVGDLAFQSRLYANLAVTYRALTDRCEAEGVEAAQTGIDLDRRLGLLDHLPVPLIVLGQIHQCHGDRELAFASYEEALGIAERVGEPQFLLPCYDGLATLYLDAGDQARARIFFAKSQDVCERAKVDPDALMMLPFLC